jgi:phosphohistidine swiveling domain-containing protein
MAQFTTKAQTLEGLQGKLQKFSLLPQISFTVNELLQDADKIKQNIEVKFGNRNLIVRSSAIGEDSESTSMAGHFLSVANVSPSDILDAAHQVMDSYKDNNPNNQVLVQPMLTDVAMSGVLFTLDPNTGGNYFVVNYDNSGYTDSVTSGESNDIAVCYIFHGKKSGDPRLDRLCDAALELIGLFGKKAIDIEFAFNNEGELYLLQVRPLVVKRPAADFNVQKEALERAHSRIAGNVRCHPYARGRRTIFGVMPDWNPAEMIGIRPRPLASSLYRRLITDGIWAYQRDAYGYKNLRSFPLMHEFCGLPYIDIRASFNSFIPKDIDDKLSNKLADYYLDRLASEPDKHDKVEFDIVFSCNTFDLPERIKGLAEYGFDEEEQTALRQALRKLTNNIINVKAGLWIGDTEKIDILDKRREIVIKSDMDAISKVYWLLEDCARYGTLPFAGLARAGFISVLLLKSLVTIGILNEKEYQNYMGSLHTISTQMSEDTHELSRSAFLKKYGHLRPGTYDILSPRYDIAHDLYLGDVDQPAAPHAERETFTLSLEQYAAIHAEMEKQHLEGDVLALFKFIKAGVEGREYSKFVFTKSLSFVLELFAEIGESYGFNRDDMSYLDCSVINLLYSSTADIRRVIANSIQEGKHRYAETLSMVMPPVIISPDDIYAFHMPSGSPNFITLKNVSGEICSDNLSRERLSGKILLVPAADPGFDWIFSCNILGFITAYGGANSHMAIRASELGIPAVIGIGEKEYTRISQAKTLHIDCANKKIEVLQ